MTLDGRKVYQRRTAKRWTRMDLADRCGVTAAAVERWELRGGQPRLPTAALLAQALGCTIDELLTDPQLFRP